MFLDKTWFGPVGRTLEERDAYLREKLSSVKGDSGELNRLQVPSCLGRTSAGSCGVSTVSSKGQNATWHRCPLVLACLSPDILATIHLLAQSDKSTTNLLQEEAERVVAEARKEAQATIAEAKASTQEEQNKKLAEIKAVSAPRCAPTNQTAQAVGPHPVCSS